LETGRCGRASAARRIVNVVALRHQPLARGATGGYLLSFERWQGCAGPLKIVARTHPQHGVNPEEVIRTFEIWFSVRLLKRT
jgi:hypothetical protein